MKYSVPYPTTANSVTVTASFLLQRTRDETFTICEGVSAMTEQLTEATKAKPKEVLKKGQLKTGRNNFIYYGIVPQD
jgi:hypothetical protein